MTQERTYISDETLTAYLDGALEDSELAKIDAALAADEDLRARCDALTFPVDDLRAIMAPDVLKAPALPSELLKTEPPRTRFWVPTAVAAAFVVGMVVPQFFAPSTPTWTEAVASYQALYVTETLSNAAQSPEDADLVLARAAKTFGVDLEHATQVQGMTFKRAQMLGFEGRPLLQMAYLTPDGTPMALCLVAVNEAERGPEPSMMFGLAGVSWVENGVGFFLIGGGDAGQIDAFSSQIIASL